MRKSATGKPPIALRATGMVARRFVAAVATFLAGIAARDYPLE